MGFGYGKEKKQCGECGEHRALNDLTVISDMGKKTYECRNSKQCSKNSEWRKSLEEEKKMLKDAGYALKKYYSISFTELIFLEKVSDSFTSLYYYQNKDQLFTWDIRECKWKVSGFPHTLRQYIHNEN